MKTSSLRRSTRHLMLNRFCAQMMTSSSVLVAMSLTACHSHPIVPDGKNVTISRDDAAKDCRELGRVQGSVTSVHGTVEQAIEDMKTDAARKGANFVHMEATSALGTSVSGTAYFCP